MKLSKKSRYGLRALIDLAVNSRTEQVSLGSIAQRNDISAQYLEHVFSGLRKAHIVKSIKGSQGGYFLEKAPELITVAEIVEVTILKTKKAICQVSGEIRRRSSI